MSSYSGDPHAVSKEEAYAYYAGLPSSPLLLYRTGQPWSAPSGPEAYRRYKELRPVFDHPIADVWTEELAMKIVAILDEGKLRFSSIDVVKFKLLDESDGSIGESDTSPVTIWIGVFESTSPTLAYEAGQNILAVLATYNLQDVDVDFRVSLYVNQVGPELLPQLHWLQPLAAVISPITPALGIPISTRQKPNVQGTLGLYIAEGGERNRLLGLTCRHVVVPADQPNDEVTTPLNVIVLGTEGFTRLLDSIRMEAGLSAGGREEWAKQIPRMKAKALAADQVGDAGAVKEATDSCQVLESLVAGALVKEKALEGLFDDLKENWEPVDNRALGRLVYSPSIKLGAGKDAYTEDWAVLQIDKAKLGPGFQGNVLDLGMTIKPEVFKEKCFPTGDADKWGFEYPDNRLLRLEGIVSDKEMRLPRMRDRNGEHCLLVVKSGNASGTTLGRANGIFSIVRKYSHFDPNTHQTSFEWCIWGLDRASARFSAPGDSGSIVADVFGHIGGMITGGAGQTDALDVTYATPFWWLLERVRGKFPNADLDGVRPSV